MGNSNRILFVPTNGAGLGHLTRCLAIARRIRQLDSSKEIIFFTTSTAMQLVLQEGFLGYHLPSKSLFSKNDISKWNALYKEHLKLIIQLHRPGCIVFDGVYPYAGLLASLREAKGIKKIWLRRGQSKITNESIISKEKEFNKVIIPGEFGSDTGVLQQQNFYFTNPIVYLNQSELLDRNIVRSQWNIPEHHKLVFVQLGAGNINNINPTLKSLLTILNNMKNVSVVMGESIISKDKYNYYYNNLTIIKDYPLSQYFNAFDLAITAAGYNTFHELLYFKVPAIFIPNAETQNDNQLVRARNAEQQGAAIVGSPVDTINLEKIITLALTEDKQKSMRNALSTINFKNGADDVANFLVNYYLK